MTLTGLVLELTACALAIAWAGYALSRSADQIAAMRGWGRGWVGLALLATVTSLPELASGISAVVWVAAPNLAIGNALGACIVNLLFLVVVDALQRGQPMYRTASEVHLLSSGFGVVMLGFVAMSLLEGGKVPALLHVGLYSPLLLALYLLALRGVHAHEHRDPGEHGRVAEAGATGSGAWLRFAFSALAVLAAGTWLPQVAEEFARSAGVSRSFVGTVLMAVVTTMPEMAVTVSALRLGALDMAIGNLLGSNLFNVAILAIDDVFYTPGPLLAAAAPAHAGTAVTAVIMVGLVTIGLVMRPQGRLLRVVSWISVGLIAVYVINVTLLYLGAA